MACDQLASICKMPGNQPVSDGQETSFGTLVSSDTLVT